MQEPYEKGIANHSTPSFAAGAVKPPLKRKQDCHQLRRLRASHRLSVGRQSLQPQYIRCGAAASLPAGLQGWLVCMGTGPAISGSHSRRRSVEYAVLWQAGLRNVTCSLGNRLSAHQSRQLHDGRARTAYVTLDADNNGSGQQAAQWLAGRLSEQGLNGFLSQKCN
jgi:hypothetical protein